VSVYLGEGESGDSLIQRFSEDVVESGTIADFKRHARYLSPGRRQMKKRRADKKRRKRRKRNEELDPS
jgi:ribosomal protein S21